MENIEVPYEHTVIRNAMGDDRIHILLLEEYVRKLKAENDELKIQLSHLQAQINDKET